MPDQSRQLPPLIILTGPTAVGKTAASVALAKRIGAEIVSADSMQVYRKMNIGTAKITPEEMEGVRHYLIDVLDPTEAFDVVRFQSMAKQAISQIYERGKLPILAGGTGFYIQAVLYDIDFSAEEEDHTLRRKLEAEAEMNGREALHDRLRAVDPASADAIPPGNVKRVIRALEYYEKNGRPISRHNLEQRQRESCYNAAYFVLNDERPVIYDRINRRVDIMMQQGLLQEVQELKEQGCTKDLVSMQGIGYRQILDHLDGLTSLDEAVERIKKETRHFAKRQLTWFRREKDVIWLSKNHYTGTDALLDEMIGILKGKGIINAG